MSGSPHRIGPYELVAPLGKGGMAEVFRARVVEGEREGWKVAIKRLLPELSRDPAYVTLFVSESDLSRSLHHPNIVQVLDVGRTPTGDYFMVMDLVDGRDLGQILRRCKKKGIQLPVDFGLYLARTLLEALDHAHNVVGPTGEPLRIVHCDVSPSNVFISRMGEIKLGDFGIARAAALDNALLGKPYYLSPEVLAGEVSPATDLWAATVILYELLTLCRPFQGKTPDEVFEAIRERRMEPLRTLRPEAPEAVEAILARGFALDPSARFGSAREYADALAPLYDDGIGTPLAIAAVVRGLFGAEEASDVPPAPKGEPTQG